jgi:carboxyl-terminal processing protease
MASQTANKIKKTVIFFLTVVFALLVYEKLDYLFYNAEDYARKENIDRLSEVLEDIHQNYVDTVDWNKSVDGAINGLLDKLDPHSVYIDKKEVQRNE